MSYRELYDSDNEIRTSHGIICGVDEAGRGPLAGDVFAAAVILKPDCLIEDLNDSKKLTERKRAALYNEIIGKAEAYSIERATVAEIEELNILGAAMLAMKRAVESLRIRPRYALIDGDKLPKLNIPCEAIVKGDSLSASIAAASVLAKVARDNYMQETAQQYPQYCFGKHKGYGTKLHYKRLSEHGPCPVHRMSFLKKFLAGGKETHDK